MKEYKWLSTSHSPCIYNFNAYRRSFPCEKKSASNHHNEKWKEKKISSEGNLIKSMLAWKIAGKNSFSLPKNYSDIIE